MSDVIEIDCPLCGAEMFWTGWGWRCRKHGTFKESELIRGNDEHLNGLLV